MGVKCITPGILFALLSQVQKNKDTSIDHFKSENQVYKEPEMFKDLVYVVIGKKIVPNEGTFKRNVSEYKSCKTNGCGYIPFDNSTVISTFDDAIKQDYIATLSRMIYFVEKHIDSKYYGWLIKEICNFIDDDIDIPKTDLIYINSDGLPSKVESIIKSTSFEIESFLLGVLHYLIVSKDDNTKGANTFSSLFTNDYGKRKNIYDGGIGIVDDYTILRVNNVSPATGETPKSTYKCYINDIACNDLTNHNEYNLVVVQYDEFEDDCVHIYYNGLFKHSNLDKEFIGFTDDLLERITACPTIFANENGYSRGRCPDDQIAYLGIVVKIRELTDFVKVYYEIIASFPQNVLNEYAEDLDIAKPYKGIVEMDEMHWSLKNVDLFEVFTENEIELMPR